MKKNDLGLWKVVIAVLVGGLLGAGAMWLYAPQSGKKTRAKIQRKAEHQAKELQERGQAVLADQKERLSNLVEAGKTTVEDILK
jgi:gas vesicle protein